MPAVTLSFLVIAAGRLGRESHAAQIGNDHRVIAYQIVGKRHPHVAGLAISMQQHDPGSRAALAHTEFRRVRRQLPCAERLGVCESRASRFGCTIRSSLTSDLFITPEIAATAGLSVQMLGRSGTCVTSITGRRCTNGREMKEESFEVRDQVLISSQCKLLSSKAMVVNVAEKSKRDFGRRD